MEGDSLRKLDKSIVYDFSLARADCDIEEEPWYGVQ